MKKLILFPLLFAAIAAISFADSVTIKVGGVDKTINDLPTDIVNLINKNLPKINDAINEYGITSEQIDDAISSGAINDIKNFYATKDPDYAPITKSTNALNDFSKELAGTIPSVQFAQNVYPDAWIGMFFPFAIGGDKKGAFHINAGANAGVAQMRLGALKAAADALELGMEGFPDSLVFPTITADLRIGGIFLPFDIGFTVMKLDTSKMNKINGLISPACFEYFTIGFDARWAFFKGNGKLPVLSAGLGYYFSKGALNVADGDASANTGFKTSNFYLQAQISKKFLFFIPFVGTKLGFTKSNVSWAAKPDWNSIFDSNVNQNIGSSNLQELGILPEQFDGGFDGFKFVTQFFGGFAFDFYVGHITFFGGYDVVNKIWSAGANLRFGW